MDDEQAAGTTDAQDGGWSVDSASALPINESLDHQSASLAEDASPSTESVPEPVTPVSEPSGTPGAPPPKRKKQTFQERIDELTGQRRSAERDLDTERTQRQDLERRLAALERGRVETPPAPAPVPTPAPAVAAMPEPPTYANFETDEQYNAALTTWRTDIVKWQAARELALKHDITSSVDTRLKQERQALEDEAFNVALAERFSAMRDAHPDFVELTEAHADALKAVTAVFVQDVIQNTPDGPELLYDLAKTPDLALALGALPLPTRPLADAVRESPSARALMKHFATPTGREDFLRLRTLHPIAVIREIGRLETRLETAASGPVPAHPITNAVPSAKPPVGSPRARDVVPAAQPGNFETWMADEDAKDLAKKRARFGLPASA